MQRDGDAQDTFVTLLFVWELWGLGFFLKSSVSGALNLL